MMRFALVLIGFSLVLGYIGWRSTGEVESFAIAIPALLFAAAAASHRVAALHRPLVILAFTAVGWLLDQPVIGLAVGVAFSVYAVASSRKLPADFTSDTVVETVPNAVGVGAEGFVEEFVRLGYRQVGAFTFRTQGHEIVESIMIGPAGDRYALVTDAILAITSRFGSRSLVTRNSALSRMPPDMLDNPLQGGSPHELDACHSEALALLAPHAEAERIDAKAVTALAIDDEKRSIDWARSLRTHLQPGGGAGHGPLASHPSAQQLITGWLTATERN